MEEKHAKDDGSKATQRPHCVLDWVSEDLPFLEENGRCDDGQGGEHDVVYRSHNGDVENVQCLIQIVHLDSNAGCHSNEEEPSQWVQELAGTGESEFDGYAQSFACHDRERANE